MCGCKNKNKSTNPTPNKVIKVVQTNENSTPPRVVGKVRGKN